VVVEIDAPTCNECASIVVNGRCASCGASYRANMPGLCRHCHWGDWPSGHFPNVALTECNCVCHKVDP
jgi:hypothetical protein